MGGLGGRVRSCIGAIALGSFALLCSVGARAQSMIGAPPPIHSSIDGNGVDLVTGAFNLTTSDLSIGPDGPEALIYKRSFIGGGSFPSAGWTDNLVGTIAISGATYTVSFGGGSESFTLTGGVYVPAQGQGSTLSYNSGTQVYTYTASDGTVVLFSVALGGTYAPPTYANGGRPTTATSPDGHVTTYTYKTISVCQTTCPGTMVSASRLQSVNNNAGYQLKITYLTNSASNASDLVNWTTVSAVAAINNAIDYCSPSADSCSGFSVTWPSVSYAYFLTPDNYSTYTDALNRVTKFYYAGTRLKSIRRPSSSVDTTTITYTTTPNPQVASVSNEIGTWNYGYVLTGTTAITTVTDPLTNNSVAYGDTTTGLLSKQIDSLNRTTSYLYDSNQRLIQTTLPAGDEFLYHPDKRGNIDTITHVSATGSPPDTIITRATFDDPCTSPAKCNKPNTTTDGNGNVTNYVYDSTKGVLTSVTLPTTGAVRPQTRLGYTSLYAWYKNSAGTVVQAPTPIYKPTSTSACQTLASCAGMADEVKGTLAYGVSGVANNLALTSSSQGSGDGALTATTSYTWDSIGNRLTVQTPLGAAQTIRTRYDAARQTIGVIGPDPDGAGPLKFPALRYTYNSDGQVTLVERGTVNSQSDSDWALFATLEQTASAYDIAMRKTQTSFASGGTTWSLSQFTYDDANNLQCTAVRMNPAIYGSLPASACSQGAAGANGPDIITFNTYDAANQLIKITNGYGAPAQTDYAVITYTDNGLVKRVTDAENNLTTYYYDGFSRRTQNRYPMPTQGAGASNPSDYQSFEYDANGNVTSMLPRGGTRIYYARDALNRITQKSFAGGAQTPVYYAYDLLGRMLYAHYTSTTGPGVDNAWDALGRMTSSTASGRTLSYQYDLAGNRTRVTWPDAAPNALYMTYVYDLLNRVTAVEQNGATSGTGLLASYAYDNLGRTTGVTRAGGAGASTSLLWDGADRLSALTHDFASTADDVTWGFTYSPADQAISRTSTNDAYSFHPSAGSRNYTTNGLNQYATVLGTAFSYDVRGNLSADATRTYTYDLENNLLTGSAPTATVLTYDPLGRLQTSTAGGATTTLLYDGDDLVGEYDGSGNILDRYVFGPGNDAPIVWYQGAGTASANWLLADNQNSVVAWANSAGALSGSRGYGPYGEPSSWGGPRFAYTGQIMIAENRLYGYKARAYDPWMGRFLQTDPIGYQSDINAYAYVNNDPINGTDPSGLASNDDSNPQRPIDGFYIGGSVTDLGPPLIVPAPPRDNSTIDFQSFPVSLQFSFGFSKMVVAVLNENKSKDDKHDPCSKAEMRLNYLGDQLEKFGNGVQWASVGLGVIGALSSEAGGEAPLAYAGIGLKAGTTFEVLGSGLQGYAKGGAMPAFTNASISYLQDFLVGKLTGAALKGVLGKHAVEEMATVLGQSAGAVLQVKQSCGH